MAPYQYEALPGDDYTRLLIIEPGEFDHDIVICLHSSPFSEDEPPEYEALSYAWGSKENPCLIRVSQHSDATLEITQNLEVALRHLRHRRDQRVMWIDAICIDQSNLVERGSQVAMMGRIYRSASRAVVWLGEERDGSGRAMELMNEVGPQVEVDRVTHGMSPAAQVKDQSMGDVKTPLPFDVEDQRCIPSLLCRSWFDRLWIRQEIFLGSSRSLVLCGSAEVPWQIFRIALAVIFAKPYNPPVGVRFLRRLNHLMGFIFQRKPLVGEETWVEDAYEQLGNLLREIEVQNSHTSNDSRLETFARTFCANEFKESCVPTHSDQCSLEEVMSVVSYLLSESYETATKDIDNVGFVLSHMISCLIGKQVFLASVGYIGLAPDTAQLGDQVCALVGCNNPMLLRPVGENRFLLIGTCFMDGASEGEALLGPLPENVRTVLVRNEDGYRNGFINDISGKVFYEDPRFDSLSLDLTDYRSRLQEDPHRSLGVDPEILRRPRGRPGVDVKYFDLV